MADIVVSQEHNGTSLAARVGDTIELVLPDTPSTGYRWEVEILDPSHIDVAEAGIRHEGDAGVGAGGVRSWRLRVLRSGTTSLAFTQRRPWESDEAPVDRFAIVVEAIDSES